MSCWIVGKTACPPKPNIKVPSDNAIVPMSTFWLKAWLLHNGKSTIVPVKIRITENSVVNIASTIAHLKAMKEIAFNLLRNKYWENKRIASLRKCLNAAFGLLEYNLNRANCFLNQQFYQAYQKSWGDFSKVTGYSIKATISSIVQNPMFFPVIEVTKSLMMWDDSSK